MKWRKKELKKEEDINKQCLCGRSNMYPYCDGTHKIKNNIIQQVMNNNES